MTLSTHIDQSLTPRFGADTFYSVYDDSTGKRVGTIAEHGAPGRPVYRVFEAGTGVTVVDPMAVYPTPQAAADAIETMREASPALAVDAFGLTGFQRDVLDFEAAANGVHRPNKADTVRHIFGVSSVRYAQIVNALIDLPAAMAYRSRTVTALRAERDAARTGRSARYAGLAAR